MSLQLECGSIVISDSFLGKKRESLSKSTRHDVLLQSDFSHYERLALAVHQKLFDRLDN